MPKQFKSILEELEHIPINRDSRYIIESRGDNIIASAINLLEVIEQTYSVKEAEDLTRKFLNSIRLKDPAKFKRSLGRINEDR